jgi:hypothetical protein
MKAPLKDNSRGYFEDQRQLFESQCFQIISFACDISTSACAECLVPASTDTMQEGRIDDQLPERVDQRHVERRQAADLADIDR